MNKKKIIITVISLCVVAALVVGGIFGYQRYQDNHLFAEVQSVSDLNWGYWGEQMSSYGMVTNDFSQEVYLLDEQTIEEIYVEEGQEVKEGDPLMAYDMTITQLKIEMQELEIQSIDNNLVLANRELQNLKNTTPIVIPDPRPEWTEPPEPPEPPELPKPDKGPQKEGKAYRYISTKAKAYDGTGKIDDPYLFLCTPDCYVEGEWINELSSSKKPVFAILEVRKKNEQKGKLLLTWEISSSSLMIVEDDSRWSIETRQQVFEPEPEEPEEPDYIEEDPEELEIPDGYTAEELKKMIRAKELDIRDLDLDKRKEQLELDQMKKLTDTGAVVSTVNGTVKSVGDSSNPPKDGSPFMVVSGSEGLYVSGSLSELMLGEIKVGQTVYANSWESGLSFEATITEISEYPTDAGNSWGEGNPNVSYYPYTAYIEDSKGLKNGEYVELTINAANQEGTESEGIYLQKAYIREENGQSYALKADANDHLVKQYVKTGKTIYGEAVEIVSGLTKKDRIAFPYGKSAKEGIKAAGSSDTGLGMY
ncbi:efflux RND transporter periplasmic adaptor subunit [Lachnospiraceae bacterium ZAX-1]